ncbi:MAG: hypothetical protein JWP87_514 [Labilithrix sp.]|nr:hypothetical protein [Labilithrix sp.]
MLPAPIALHKQFLRVVYVFAAMSGWRLDRLNAAWIVGGALSLAAGQILIGLRDPALSLSFFAFSLLFYYGGNTAFLVSKLPARMIARWGEARAYRIYETVLALMFINQGLGVACVGSLSLGPRWLLSGSPMVLTLLGVALSAAGIVTKLWATVLAGVDVYYYRDMFLGRPVSTFVAEGPYRILRNPMYGVGQLHAYGIAILMSRTWNGVLAAATCHALIYVFYFTAERPFVERMYLTVADSAPFPAIPAPVAPRAR